MTTHPADTSNLSISGVEDWDALSSNGTVPFPAGDSQEEEHRTSDGTGRSGDGNGRTLSQLLRLYAEKGTDVCFSQEEADAVAEALGQWINSGSSPYEGEDDFPGRSRDDIALRRPSPCPSGVDAHGRPRGQSESVVQRAAAPTSSS